MNFIGRLLENSRDEKFIHRLSNIWGGGLADMQSLSKYNKGIKHLLCAIDFFSKYAWFFPLKDKRGISIVNTGRKPNKIWFDQGGELYDNLFKSILKINNIEMSSTCNICCC